VTTTRVTAPTGVSSSRIPGAVFVAPVMSRITRVAMLIVRRIGMEAVERVFPAFGERSMVAVVRIVALVDMAIKPMMSVEPGAGPNEYPSSEPIRTIVAVGCTVIRSIRKVAVGAHWSHPNVDRHLCRCTRNAAEHG
jgi:hypothetical protein